MPDYTHIQFIGYSIDTAPRLNADKSKSYLGLTDAQQDIEARCILMQRALDTARDNLPQASPPNPPGSTLTVFMAPEFFFRGAAGFYQMDDVQSAIARLQEIAADHQWTDWVLAFGTIVGGSELPAPASPVDPSAPTHEIYNFALIQQGGVASQGADGARVVMKELKSGIDFIAGSANPGGILSGAVKHLEPGNPGGPGRERQQIAYDGAGIFSLGGLTWAADICLDFLTGRLLKSPQLPGEAEVQVQLIPSCGATINPDEVQDVIAAPGGYVFNVDGHNGSHTDLQQIQAPLAAPAEVAQLGSYAVAANDIMLTNPSPPNSVQIGQLYRRGAGRVVIYPAVAAPAAGKVQGTFVRLHWKASEDYRFRFDLVYDARGDFMTVLCVVESTKLRFRGNRYFLPLDLEASDIDDREVRINVKSDLGSGNFDRAVWCKIAVPGFSFQGVAFQFDDRISGTPPEVAW
jgi:hypothetical protein